MIAFAALLMLATPALSADRWTANDGHVALEDVPQIDEAVVEDLRRYQGIRSAAFADWAPVGGLYTKTRFADTVQLHRVDTPGGARHQLTFYGEPVGSVTRQPGHDTLAFTMDTGGSEQAQIYLWDRATAAGTLVTGGESRHGSLVWSHDGARLAFQSNRGCTCSTRPPGRTRRSRGSRWAWSWGCPSIPRAPGSP